MHLQRSAALKITSKANLTKTTTTTAIQHNEASSLYGCIDRVYLIDTKCIETKCIAAASREFFPSSLLFLSAFAAPLQLVVIDCTLEDGCCCCWFYIRKMLQQFPTLLKAVVIVVIIIVFLLLLSQLHTDFVWLRLLWKNCSSGNVPTNNNNVAIRTFAWQSMRSKHKQYVVALFLLLFFLQLLGCLFYHQQQSHFVSFLIPRCIYICFCRFVFFASFSLHSRSLSFPIRVLQIVFLDF